MHTPKLMFLQSWFNEHALIEAFETLAQGRSVQLSVSAFMLGQEQSSEFLTEVYTLALLTAAHIGPFDINSLDLGGLHAESILGVTLTPTATSTRWIKDSYHVPSIDPAIYLVTADDWTKAITAAKSAEFGGLDVVTLFHEFEANRLALASMAEDAQLRKEAQADRAAKTAAKAAADQQAAYLAQQKSAELSAAYAQHTAGRPTGQRNQGNYHNSRLKRGSIPVLFPAASEAKRYYSDDWTGDRIAND